MQGPSWGRQKLGRRFGYFLFFLLGGGKGESEATGGEWGRFFFGKSHEGGGLRVDGGGGGRGAWRVFAGNLGGG